jgi:hypothetical protein
MVILSKMCTVLQELTLFVDSDDAMAENRHREEKPNKLPDYTPKGKNNPSRIHWGLSRLCADRTSSEVFNTEIVARL